MSNELKLAIGEISEHIKTLQSNGKLISNFTIGDFYPKVFKIPTLLTKFIKQTLVDGLTDYPMVGGESGLKKILQVYVAKHCQLKYELNQFIVASGARALIYLVIKALLKPGEKVIVSVPNWNLINFISLNYGDITILKTTEEGRFLLQAEDLSEEILFRGKILCLNIPHNPSGSSYTAEEFKKITQLLIKENQRRIQAGEEPLWVVIDIVYKGILSGVNAFEFLEGSEALLPWIIWIDGASKIFCATGLRIGWAFGPEAIIRKMVAINGCVGAWAAKPIQCGMMKFLQNFNVVECSINKIYTILKQRKELVTKYLLPLKKKGYLNYIIPSYTIYLSIDFSKIVAYLSDDLENWLLEKVQIGIVNFRYFGLLNTNWYRVSLVNTSQQELKDGFKRLKREVMLLFKKGSIS